MTDTYKATPEQWQAITDLRLLELQARIEQLEAQAGNLKGSLTSSTPPPVATDEELKAMWNVPGTNLEVFRAVYNLGVAHGQAGSREVAEPAPVAGGLVERVRLAIFSVSLDEEARAAILEVAKWLYERSWNLPADLLKREAGR
jgi:hypothetical protein